MIKIENLSFGYPQKDLYEGISLTLEEGQHCAFIGSSGSGKTTLIDMIIDPEKYMYKGLLDLGDNPRIGYVSQFYQVDNTEDITVFEYIAMPFIEAEERIADICTQMETATDLEPLLEAYQEALDAHDAIGGEDYDSAIKSQLNLAELSHIKNLKLTAISGGEYKLVQVIKEMMVRPDLIIMDEPDVFLDFENLGALRQLINGHKGTLLIITHSRFLLDHCFDKIIHLENKKINEFEGRYIDYNFELLETKIELQELAVADEEELARNEAMIERLRDVSTYNADPARGRSLKARVKIQERLEANKTIMPFVAIKEPQIKFDAKFESVGETEDGSDTAGETIKVALSVNEYNLAFEEVLLEDVTFEIGSKDKVALIGGNGTGKTTLLREIYLQYLAQNHQSLGKSLNNGSNLNPSDILINPSIKVNKGTKIGYLSQIQGEVLNENNTVLNEFMDMGFPTYDLAKAYLEKYNFVGEGLDQKIGALSGGEKNILQLAKIGCSDTNLLLLDEPTSHLDTYSQIALEQALMDYEGAILMISHDYYSIVNAMDYVLVIDDKKMRRSKLKKFKRMIYANHLDRDYVDVETEKKAVEVKIGRALQDKDFESAKALAKDLEKIIAKL